MSALGQHNDPVVALTGGDENAVIRWMPERPNHNVGQHCVVSRTVWLWSPEQRSWVIPGERSAVA